MKIQGINNTNNLRFASTYKVTTETTQVSTYVEPVNTQIKPTQRDTNPNLLGIVGRTLGNLLMSSDSYSNLNVRPELDYYA